MRLGSLVLFSLAALACSSSGGDGTQPTEDAGRPSPGFDAAWAEFLGPSEIRSQLGVLRDHDLALNFAWPASRVNDADYLDLVREAADAGVEIRPWLLLAESDGYWPGATNAEIFAVSARELFDAWDDRGYEPTTFIVDMEMRFDRSMQVNAILQSDAPDLEELVTLLASGIDRTRYASATATYDALVDDAQARGWRVLLTTLPQVVDDYEDGDDDVRQALGIPVDGPEWDVVTFQAYRTLFGDLLSDTGTPTPFFVYDYGRSALEFFGAKGGLDLGLVGMGVSASPVYPSGQDLRADVEAAHAAGVPPERINVFSFDGMIERGPAEDWLMPPRSEPPAPSSDPATEQIRQTSAFLDGVLVP